MTVQEMQADYDWRCAFYEAKHGGATGNSEGESDLDDVVEIIAASAGEKDERDWIALVRLNDGRYAKMFSGCDYTGWDCRASGNIEFYATKEELLSPTTLMDAERERLGL